jgi:oligo-1,6-glucosidase/alpha-glucosidase
MERIAGISLNRDECRTPMQWSPIPNGGFCEPGLTPWLPIGPNHESINVEVEEKDTDSILNLYKDLLNLRNNTPALHSGTIELKETMKHQDSVLVYERAHNDEVLQIWLNFANKSLTIPTDEIFQELLFSTMRDSTPLQQNVVILEPHQGIVVKIR